ncbi:hypothetical protein ACTHQ1_05115 [Janibacter anophelis]|uniref:hypothetical protein n=1 Tax=Janibacter anophelis TaxID=319054 RepID=UPI003F811C47
MNDLSAQFQAAGEEYARRLDETRERDRLAALALEARRESNAQAFADAVAPTFTDTSTQPESTTAPTTADDLMAAIAADTTKENN